MAALTLNQTWTGPAYFSNGHIAAHSPSTLRAELPSSARKVVGKFGFFPGSYEKPQDSTDGAYFSVHVISRDGTRQQVFSRRINPRDQAEHRGDQAFTAEIPATEGATIEFSISPLPDKGNAYGWTYWKDLGFELTRS